MLLHKVRAAKALEPGLKDRTSYRSLKPTGNAGWGLAVALTLMLSGCSWIDQIPVPTPTPKPTPTPTPAPEPTPCPPGTSLVFGQCVPNPEPTPTPTPTPPPSGDFFWRESDGTEQCPKEGDDGLYRADVELALDQSGVSFPTGLTEAQVYAQMAPYLAVLGLHSAMLSEELAVAGVRAFSENYDLVLANGNRRKGVGTYRSTCRPATRTAALPDAPVPSNPYPYSVDKIEIKPHNGWMDGVALHCGEPNAAFPGRPCWPACGPEAPGRKECDENLNPYWEGPGKNHPTNPWLYKKQAPNPKAVRACVQNLDRELTTRTVCSNWE